MQLTIQADDMHRFNKILRWIVKKPKYLTAHFVPFRGKSALMVKNFDWTLLMPLKGRKPVKPFKIPYKYLCEIPDYATGKVIINILPEKKIGEAKWGRPDGWLQSVAFPFGCDGFSAAPVPSEATELKEYPTSLLDDIWRCARISLNPHIGNLYCVCVRPDSELWSSDGHRALLIRTPYTFGCGENTLIRSCELLGKRELRSSKSFRMGFDGRTVHFDFGDFHFWTEPQYDRYPDFRKTVPAEETIQTRLSLDPHDAAFLKKHLDDLPGRKDHDSPITLICDYGGDVFVHGSTSYPEETKAILLARSTFEGDAYVLQMNRKFFLDALSLGCLDFRLGTSYPLGLKQNIRYCWIQLDGGALPLESERPSPPAVLLRSDQPISKEGKI